MTNKELLNIAKRECAIDLNCEPTDFDKTENVVLAAKPARNAHQYGDLPYFCDMMTFGNNIVAAVYEPAMYFVEGFINGGETARCFETPNLHVLTDEFKKYGALPCFMTEYWLPDLEVLKPLPCSYEIKVLEPEDFQTLYLKQWDNALCEDWKVRDRLAAGAYDGEELIGLAGCSEDKTDMWQIGIDVLPEYRRKGIASALTSRLAIEVVKRGKTPFYSCAWSNLPSARNAVKSGFRPVWAELTSISEEKANAI